MSIRNKMAKLVWYIFVYAMTLIESYLIALLGVSVIASLVFAVWSFITPLPAYVGRYYGVLLLQSAIPLCVVIFIYIVNKAKIRK